MKRVAFSDLPPPPALPPLAYESKGYWQTKTHCRPMQVVFWLGEPPEAEEEEEEEEEAASTISGSWWDFSVDRAVLCTNRMANAVRISCLVLEL